MTQVKVSQKLGSVVLVVKSMLRAEAIRVKYHYQDSGL